MNRDETKALWAKVQTDNRRKEGCPMHQFDAQESYVLGAQYPCKHCGCLFRISDIGLYAQGFAAAGGDKNMILPGMGDPQP